MDETLTRVTIWLALGLYAANELLGRSGPEGRVRWLLTLGCGLYLAHVALAFQVHHDWSHTVAVAHTAAQTQALVGWHWDGGIYINYLFSIIWVGETAWWWLSPQRYCNRTRWLEPALRAFFLFIIVNGAVVFVDGPQRWLGMAIVGVLLVAWLPSVLRQARSETRTG